MTYPFARRALTTAALLLAFGAPLGASAAPPTKDECLQAHSKGQDARDAAQLTQARTLFLVCAQNACPAIVQADCARLAEELDRLQPSVTFSARDGAQDLPDTQVFVDATLVTSKLSDGRTYDVDPGPHKIRFVHEGRETIVSVVINQGEKARAIVAMFGGGAAPGSPASPSPAAPPPPTPSRSATPLVFAAIGGAAAAAGAILVGVGFGKVPSTCSVSTNECAAPPNDPAFDKASSGVGMANVGFVVGGLGLATLVTSLIVYGASTPKMPNATGRLTPLVRPNGVGFTF